MINSFLERCGIYFLVRTSVTGVFVAISLLHLVSMRSFAGDVGRATKENQVEDGVYDCFEEDETKDFHLRPNCKGMTKVNELEGKIVINSYGIREREPKDLGGKEKILLLGQSNMFGVGLDQEFTWVRILEKKLKMNGENIELINGSIPGYSSVHHLLGMEELIRAYRPNTVILFLDVGNDFFKDRVILNLSKLDAEGIPNRIAKNPSWIFRILPSYFNNSAIFIYSFLQAVVEAKARMEVSLKIKYFCRKPLVEDCLADSLAPIYRKMNEKSLKYGAVFKVAILRDFRNNSWYFPGAVRHRVGKFFDIFTPGLFFDSNVLIDRMEKYVPHVPLLLPSVFRAVGGRLSTDPHLTKKGHQDYVNQLLLDPNVLSEFNSSRIKEKK